MKSTWKKLLAMTLVASMLTGMLGVGTLAAGEESEGEQTPEITAGNAYSNQEDTQVIPTQEVTGEPEKTEETKEPEKPVVTQETEEPEGPAKWDEETGTLTITGTDYLDQAAALAYVKELGTKSTDVKALVLNDVTEIAPYAFYQTLWTALETVTIDGTDTIGNHAFFGAKALTTVTLTNVKQVGPSATESSKGNAFAECKALTTVSLENIDLVGAETFRQCSALTNLSIKDVKELGRSVFSYCTGLTSLDLDGKRDGIGDLGATVFYGCTGLAEVTMKNLDATGLQMFGYTGLESVTLENIGTVTSQAFLNCTNLETVTMDRVDAVETNVFQGCTGLNDLIVKNGDIGEEAFVSAPMKNVTLENIGTIGTNAFASCKNLETIEMSNTDGDKVDTIDRYAFYNCINLKSVTMGKVDTIGQYAFQKCTALESVTMAEIDTIDQYAFWNCSSLKTIDSLKNVKNRIGGFAFYGCSSLTGLTVEDMTKMGYNGSVEMMERMQAILAGEFQLDDASKIEGLTRDETNWTVGAIGQSEGWKVEGIEYDNQTQLMEQAKWADVDNAVARVRVDAYYTGEKQMDYIFVADLSASMAQLGNPEDDNARFYDMQSKLLDMTDKLLGTPGYDCQVAIVTFGGMHQTATQKNSGFLTTAESAQEYILSLEPLNENTDYKLGLNETLAVMQEQQSGRNTTVIFLSDGAPTRDGKNKIADLNGYNNAVAALAKQITDKGASIYGVLHSPTASGSEDAMRSMEAVCGQGNVYKSTDTESFGKAMNAAFTAAYGNNTVTIPVNTEDFDISNLKVTAGEATLSADGKTINWTLNGMPFTDHQLTYDLTLKEELANRVGSYSYNINGGVAKFNNEGGAAVDLELDVLKLTRTIYTVTYTDGVNGAAFANQSTNVVAGSATPAFVGTPSRSGYSFAGWSPAVAGTVSANVTYTAGWSSDDNGGGGDDNDDGPTTPTPRPTETPAPVVTPAPTETSDPTPSESPVIEELDENETPLAELPTETEQPAAEPPEEEFEDLEDEDVPLAEVPETGDDLGIWLMMSAGALFGLAWLGKKKEEA